MFIADTRGDIAIIPIKDNFAVFGAVAVFGAGKRHAVVSINASHDVSRGIFPCRPWTIHAYPDYFFGFHLYRGTHPEAPFFELVWVFFHLYIQG